jgi:tetratricopeptide (TPR) repeat protein
MDLLEEVRSNALELHQRGNLSHAEFSYKKILKDYPKDGLTWHYLSILSGQLGRHSDAAIYANNALSFSYCTSSVYFNLATALSSNGDKWYAAVAAFEGLALDDIDLDASLELIEIMTEAGRCGETIDLLRKLSDEHPRDVRILEQLAHSSSEIGDGNTAEYCLEKIIQLNPNQAEAWVNLANLLHMCGQPQAAEKAVKQALQLRPNFYEAYFLFTHIRRLDMNDFYAKKIVALAKEHAGQQSVHIQFAAARILDSNGMTEKAADHFELGNTLKRNSFNYSVETDVENFKRIGNLCNNPIGVIDRYEDESSSDITPLFIVGAPRSGSTLLESILVGHSKVETVGEIPYLQRLIRAALSQADLSFPDGMWQLNQSALREIRDRYLQIISSRVTQGENKTYCIDKLPANFSYVPIIAAIFPESPVLISSRNSVDTCLSCYMHLFSGPQFYSYDLDELAIYHRELKKVAMTYSKVQFYSNIYTVKYESLMKDWDVGVADILDFCGLEFEAICLTPHMTKRLIRTASSAQVRIPVQDKIKFSGNRYTTITAKLVASLNVDN